MDVSGNKTQKSTIPHAFGEAACIDMSNAVEVDFGGVMLQARQIKDLSRIKSYEDIAVGIASGIGAGRNDNGRTSVERYLSGL